MNIDKNILNITSNNLFELLKKINDQNIECKKTDTFKLINITLKLSSNNKDIFKIMNVTFNSMEVFSNFKFHVNNDDCYITASLMEWIIFCKTIINNWTYDSRLLAMFIVKITDFVNIEYNTYKTNHSEAFELNTYKEYFELNDDIYNMLCKLTTELTKVVGSVCLASNNILLHKYSEFTFDDLNTIFSHHKDDKQTFYDYKDNVLTVLSV